MYTILPGNTAMSHRFTVLRLGPNGATPIMAAGDETVARRVVDLLNRHGMEDVPLNIDPEDHDYERRAGK